MTVAHRSRLAIDEQDRAPLARTGLSDRADAQWPHSGESSDPREGDDRARQTGFAVRDPDARSADRRRDPPLPARQQPDRNRPRLEPRPVDDLALPETR